MKLRQAFLVEELFQPGQLQLLYVEVDRCIIGSAVPGTAPLLLQSAKELSADFFCQRRELGVLNIGGVGAVEVDVKPMPWLPKTASNIGRRQPGDPLQQRESRRSRPLLFGQLSRPCQLSDPPRPLGRC